MALSCSCLVGRRLIEYSLDEWTFQVVTAKADKYTEVTHGQEQHGGFCAVRGTARLCAPFNLRLEDSDALARILAGPKHRPYVRYFGALYGNDTPIDLARILESAQEARETLPPDVEYAYESDPVPHTRFFASAARVGALLSWTAALGYDCAYHWGLGGESAIPVRVIDRANVALVANKDEDGGRLFLHLVNLSCDPFATVVFEVLPPSAGGKVEILDGAVWRPAKAVWREGRLTVEADVGVYGTLALRIGR